MPSRCGIIFVTVGYDRRGRTALEAAAALSHAWRGCSLSLHTTRSLKVVHLWWCYRANNYGPELYVFIYFYSDYAPIIEKSTIVL